MVALKFACHIAMMHYHHESHVLIHHTSCLAGTCAVLWEDWSVLNLNCVSWKRVYDFESPKEFYITDMSRKKLQMYLRKVDKLLIFKPNSESFVC